MSWNFVWGFGFSLVLGGFAAWLIIDKWLLTKIRGEFKRPDLPLVIIVGAMERFMYTSCIILEVPHWIAAWLAFKVLTRWTYPKGEKLDLSVKLGNIYLIGNILTIIFGVVGGLICKHGFHIHGWSIFSS